MNFLLRVLRVAFVLLTACVFNAGAQDALHLLQRGEGALKDTPQRAYRMLVDAMIQARRDRQTAVFLRAANDLARLGLEHRIDYDSAFHWTKEAVRAVAFSTRDTALAALYYHLARFHKAAYEADDAVRFFNHSAQIYTTTLGPLSLEVADNYHGLGDVYKYTVFNFQLAEEYYEKALDIREKRHVTDSVTLFNNYYGLAATNRSQRDYEKAVSYGTVAVALSASLDRVRQEFASSMIANIYRDMGNTAEAIRYYNAALDLNEKTGQSMARASHYQNLGETMLNDSLYDDALNYFGMAEKLYRSMKVKDERLFHHMLNSKARAYSAKGDVARFEQAVKQVFRELERTGKGRSKEAADTYLMIADHYARAGKYYSAVDQCQLALVASLPRFNSLDPRDNPTVAMIGTSFSAGEILAKKGEYLSRLHRATRKDDYLKQALPCLYLAEHLLSQERNTLDTEDAKWAFLDTKYAVYESIIASLYETWTQTRDNDVLAQAYQYLERSKARSLADALIAAEQARSIGADDSLLRARARIRTDELTTANRISELETIGGRQSDVQKLRERLVALDRQLQACNGAIGQKYPGYFNVRYGEEMNPLPDVQSLARREDRVVLEYFWGSEWVYGLGIAADTVVFERIGRTTNIGSSIDMLLDHLQAEHSSASMAVFQSFVTSAHALYASLVRPFDAVLGNASLQVIPDGAINLVPFDILLQALPEKPGVDYRTLAYLLKTRSIGYAYSTSMLRESEWLAVRNPSMLAVGFTGGQRQRAADMDISELDEIEGAEKELEALALRFRSGRFLTEKEATESNFKALSPGYDILHLAIHGRGDRSTNFSARLFFKSHYDSIDDGVFHAYELYGLQLKALMAVLSACESGLGKDYRGEGMISMASAFTSAGCENTLMSLWKVNDQTSIELMDDFYEYLLNGYPIDEALRRAKLDYLERSDELTADPKVWAPLVAYGSLHQIFERERRTTYLFFAAAVVLLLGAGVYFIRQRSRYSFGGSRSPL